MSFIDQMKMAQNMMKNMSPEEVKQMMDQAKGHQKMLAEQVTKVVEEEIKKRGLVSRHEVDKMIADSK